MYFLDLFDKSEMNIYFKYKFIPATIINSTSELDSNNMNEKIHLIDELYQQVKPKASCFKKNRTNKSFDDSPKKMKMDFKRKNIIEKKPKKDKKPKSKNDPPPKKLKGGNKKKKKDLNPLRGSLNHLGSASRNKKNKSILSDSQSTQSNKIIVTTGNFNLFKIIKRYDKFF